MKNDGKNSKKNRDENGEMARFLDPTNDIAFKKIFGNEKNKDILIDFLDDVLSEVKTRKIKSLSFIDTTQQPRRWSLKQSVVDVLCEDDLGHKYIVEMQVASSGDFGKRSLLYAAKAYADQLEKGGEYGELKDVIFLAITNFELISDYDGYKSTYQMAHKVKHSLVIDGLSLTFFELPKFKKNLSELETKEDMWLYFLKHSADVNDMKLIVDKETCIKKAYDQLQSYNWSKQDLINYDASIKAARDAWEHENDVIRKSEKEGRQKGEAIGIKKGEAIGEARGLQRGLQEGIKKGKEEVAKIMLAGKSDINEISKITGLSIVEIQSLIE